MTDLKGMIVSFDIETRPAEYQLRALTELELGASEVPFPVGFQRNHRFTVSGTMEVTDVHRDNLVDWWFNATGKKKHFLRREMKRIGRGWYNDH